MAANQSVDVATHPPEPAFSAGCRRSCDLSSQWSRYQETRCRHGRRRNAALLVLLVLLLTCPLSAFGQIPQMRVPWTAGRVTGSPEPPPPLRTVGRFPQLRFEKPLLIRSDSARQRLWVAEQAGRIVSFRDSQDTATTDLFVDLKQSWGELQPHSGAAGVGAVYGLAFHPRYPQVPVCWITYTLQAAAAGQHLNDGTRLSRFHVTFDNAGVPRCDVRSERVVLTWLEGGHNGACLEFGPDGFLYVSAGDGEVPNPPDPRDAGQDVSNLLSTILRIDVLPDGDQPLYRVPADNPFVDLKDARPEIWAYGFRNPWKMSFAPDGELWVGDVGWELYEMVYRIRRGGNYGWSIMEGPQPVRPNARRGPTEILLPAVALPHTDAASVTGGYVYRGRQFPELQGAYIFGDFETRRIWSARFDGEKLQALTDLVSPSVRLVAFGEDTSDELLMLDYDQGTLYGFERQETSATTAAFPRRLSETGIFDNVESLVPAPGVVSFDINVPVWNDGATASRLLAVPQRETIEVLRSGVRRRSWILRENMFFPVDSVLARTVSLKDQAGRSPRLETQVLHFDGTDWKGYSYVWNPEQTDADLSPAAGMELTLSRYGQFDEQATWQVHSRSECKRCHNHWVGGLLAFTLPQLNRSVLDGAGAEHNQLLALRDAGWLTGAIPDDPATSDEGYARPLAKPNDVSVPVAERARTWLSVNCSHCHQNGAGGTATIDLRHGLLENRMGLLNATPLQGTFQLDRAALVVPGDASRSVLTYRVAVTGRGRMPHIGSAQVDQDGLSLIREWIDTMPSDTAATSDADGRLPVPAADEPLAGTTAALRWVAVLDSFSHSDTVREAVLAAARRSPPEISSLFERFQPAEFRRRVRTHIDPAAILQLAGDEHLGAQLFSEKRLQCLNCHRLGDVGGMIGPPLDDAGKRLTKEQLLESLLDPSRKIDPRYTTWVAALADGRVVSGLLIERDEQHVILRTTKPEDIRLNRAEIEELNPQAVSLMPDRLMLDLTDNEIAALLQFLSTRLPR